MNSYDARIIDSDGNIVLGVGAEVMCVPIENPVLITSQIKIGYNEEHPIIINESGKYSIEITFGNIKIYEKTSCSLTVFFFFQ